MIIKDVNDNKALERADIIAALRSISTGHALNNNLCMEIGWRTVCGLAADLLKHDAEPPNDPLTLEELRGMEPGKWLWIECLENFRDDKAVSAYYRKHRDYTQGDSFCCGYPGVSFGFCFSDYGISWLAYRRKPDGGVE